MLGWPASGSHKPVAITSYKTAGTTLNHNYVMYYSITVNRLDRNRECAKVASPMMMMMSWLRFPPQAR